jgi:hypothetical protein
MWFGRQGPKSALSPGGPHAVQAPWWSVGVKRGGGTAWLLGKQSLTIAGGSDSSSFEESERTVELLFVLQGRTGRSRFSGLQTARGQVENRREWGGGGVARHRTVVLSLAAAGPGHFRPPGSPSKTAQIALRESPANSADVGPNREQREPRPPTGSSESPGNRGSVASSFLNRQFAESEVAVGGVPVERVSAVGCRSSLFSGENTGIFAIRWLAVRRGGLYPAVRAGESRRIPYSCEQGIFIGWQGITGNRDYRP